MTQYRQNIPTFGEWGWSLASKHKTPLRRRIAVFDELPVAHDWLTRDLLIASFEFPANFYSDWQSIEVNHLGTNRIYRYHDQAWRGDLGIYRD